MTRITVVGAGVIGLTCAVRLAEAGHEVDVLARELPLETTSAVAGGLWLPYLAEPPELVARWALTSLAEFGELAGVAGSGVTLRSGHLLGLGDTPPAWHAAVGATRLPLHRTTDPAPGHATGWHLRVPVVDMLAYLPYLATRLADAGGTLTRLPLAELPRRGLVVNCTGVAARAMAADRLVRPVRGQVVRLENPGIEQFWVDDHGPRPTYVVPHADHLVVGGTADDGDWSTTPETPVAQDILDRATRLVPALRGARVLAHRAGLRPARPTVRVEAEHRADGGTTVHCYGHGGCGITLSWGCADDVRTAVDAAQDVPATTGPRG